MPWLACTRGGVVSSVRTSLSVHAEILQGRMQEAAAWWVVCQKSRTAPVTLLMPRWTFFLLPVCLVRYLTVMHSACPTLRFALLCFCLPCSCPTQAVRPAKPRQRWWCIEATNSAGTGVLACFLVYFLVLLRFLQRTWLLPVGWLVAVESLVARFCGRASCFCSPPGPSKLPPVPSPSVPLP